MPLEIPLPIVLLLLALIPALAYVGLGVWRHGFKSHPVGLSGYRSEAEQRYLAVLAFGAWLDADPPRWTWPTFIVRRRPFDWSIDA